MQPSNSATSSSGPPANNNAAPSSSQPQRRRSQRISQIQRDVAPKQPPRPACARHSGAPKKPKAPVNAYADEVHKFRPKAIDGFYAEIQTVFGTAPIDGDRKELEKKIKETEELIKEEYATIRKDYDGLVEKERNDLYLGWRDADEKPNVHGENLLKNTGGNIMKITIPTPEKERKGKTEKKMISYLKPNNDEGGNSLKNLEVVVAKKEIGVVYPTMTHWVNVKQSIRTEDILKLSHMPYFENKTVDRKMYSKLAALYTDGVHGFSCNWSYINNWLVYKVCRNVLRKFNGNPNVLYYALYRLWPNKFSQREFSIMFPKLCELYAEDGFDSLDLEPWKADEPKQKFAENVQIPTCYACLHFMCPQHGFSKQTSSEYPNGDFWKVHLPLPSDDTTERCGDDCWKTLSPQHIRNLLRPDAEEIEDGQVRIHLEKARLEEEGIENGAMIATMYGYWIDGAHTFCKFVAEVGISPSEDCEIKTCRDAYLLIAKFAEFVPDRRLAMNEKQKALPMKIRLNNFYHAVVDKGIMNEKQYVGCRHEGPCGLDAEDCSCKENGICMDLCQCDINCKQRFIGCSCGPGMCKTNNCQCYFANWECNPQTCKKCGCDSPDHETPCQNFAMTQMLQKQLEVRPSEIAGYGLFLLEAVKKNDFIIEYVGEKISDEEAERRGAIYDENRCSYIFNLGTGGAIDSYKIGNVSRFANHDEKNPTMVAKTKVVAGEHRIGFYASEDLKVGEELTFNYGYTGHHKLALRFHKGASTTNSKKLKTEIKVEIDDYDPTDPMEGTSAGPSRVARPTVTPPREHVVERDIKEEPMDYEE